MSFTAPRVAHRTEASSSIERVSFEAYGRRFDLVLEPNERLDRMLAVTRSRLRPMRGVVEGSPKSWVRLTRDEAGRWRGMIADGGEVYAIEPAADIADVVVQPLVESGDTPVIFRLADMLLPPGTELCGTAPGDEPPTALAVYETLTEELQPPTQETQSAPTKQLNVGIVADYQFSQFLQSQATPVDPRAAIIERMNIVDGIYSSQLGIRIHMEEPTLLDASDSSFTKHHPSGLLEELRRYRENHPEQARFGITHLLTGRNLEGETVGIAYMGSICDPVYSVSLSEAARRSATAAALIVAHEIGHNFNAPHDTEAGACESTPPDFLMAPQLNGSNQFSECSLQVMRAFIARPDVASCLVDIPVVEPEPPTSGAADGGPDGGGSGGGGRIDFVLLWLLCLLVGVTRRRTPLRLR